MDQPKKEGKTYEILAKKAGIGKSNMANLLAVYRNRPDLFERVFRSTRKRKKPAAGMLPTAPTARVPDTVALHHLGRHEQRCKAKIEMCL